MEKNIFKTSKGAADFLGLLAPRSILYNKGKIWKNKFTGKSYKISKWDFFLTLELRKKSYLIFNTHFLPIALENETFITDDNGESFCVCCYVCRKLGLCLNVSHRVFEFYALFCHVKGKHWEQFLVICRGYIRRRNQLFNIVKRFSERCSISLNHWKFLLSKVCVSS